MVEQEAASAYFRGGRFSGFQGFEFGVYVMDCCLGNGADWPRPGPHHERAPGTPRRQPGRTRHPPLHSEGAVPSSDSWRRVYSCKPNRVRRSKRGADRPAVTVKSRIVKISLIVRAGSAAKSGTCVLRRRNLLCYNFSGLTNQFLKTSARETGTEWARSRSFNHLCHPRT
jgi:hypothetical protein